MTFVPEPKFTIGNIEGNDASGSRPLCRPHLMFSVKGTSHFRIVHNTSAVIRHLSFMIGYIFIYCRLGVFNARIDLNSKKKTRRRVRRRIDATFWQVRTN
jgi:hypothetical protein